MTPEEHLNAAVTKAILDVSEKLRGYRPSDLPTQISIDADVAFRVAEWFREQGWYVEHEFADWSSQAEVFLFGYEEPEWSDE